MTRNEALDHISALYGLDETGRKLLVETIAKMGLEKALTDEALLRLALAHIEYERIAVERALRQRW